MLGLGPMELMVIAGIALLIFGPRQLPKMGKAVGQTIKEMRGIGKELQSTVDEVGELTDDDVAYLQERRRLREQGKTSA